MALITNTALDLWARRDTPRAWPIEGRGDRSIIQHDATIIGDLETDGHIEIDGTVKGTINGYMVTVAENGRVEGAITAEIAKIHGTLIGPVQANTVAVGKTAHIVGNIFHKVLNIEPGASLEGRRPWRPHIERKPQPAQGS
ncbi:MAG: polymer-forming cytoskeletal protein [Alphaproteobacteria bacterium]